MKQAFTLIELLLVMGIMAILAAIVITAINPSRQMAQARNTVRTSHVSALNDAIYMHYINNEQFPSCIDGTPRTICLTDDCSGITGNVCNVYSDIVDRTKFINDIPQDPTIQGQDSGYTVQLIGSTLNIYAPNAEDGAIIVSSR
jgi:prepilin-type N-terminal cleavage/methylation domain-containing protein